MSLSALRRSLPGLLLVLWLAPCAPGSQAQAPAPPSSGAMLPAGKKLRAKDADNHMVVLNRPGIVTLVLGTNEDSQDAARSAGIALDPLRGRPDFDLIVVVDLRDSIATWVPSVVLSQMRANLDNEAIELKPYFLKNGNKGNPRLSAHVIADFDGSICPQLGWPDGSDNLRGVLFGPDGREVKRWDKIEDMTRLQLDVRGPLQALIDIEQARAAAAARGTGSKLLQPPAPPLPLPPMTPEK